MRMADQGHPQGESRHPTKGTPIGFWRIPPLEGRTDEEIAQISAQLADEIAEALRRQHRDQARRRVAWRS